MKRVFLFILLILTGCSSVRIVRVVPTPTPEMLIVRRTFPTREPIPTPQTPPIVITLTAIAQAQIYARQTEAAYHQPQNIYSPTPRPCNIKGNVNSKGEKFYHCPNFPQYGITQINPSEGDRWFCSVADAIAAGFRAPDNGGVCIQ